MSGRPYRPYGGKKRNYTWLKALIALLLAGVLAFSALLGVVLAGGQDRIQGDPSIMIILGCQVKPEGPSILLQDRLDKALEYLNQHPDMTVVVSGGQGADEPVTEAQAMADYLTEHDVDPARILLEERSHNTDQNLRYSLELLFQEGYDTTGDLVVVSSGFHLARIRMLWGRVAGGREGLSTLAAPASHTPSRIWMYVREPLALVKSFLLDR